MADVGRADDLAAAEKARAEADGLVAGGSDALNAARGEAQAKAAAAKAAQKAAAATPAETFHLHRQAQAQRARVLGIDVSPALVETARTRAGHHANAEFAVADASRWRATGFAPELVVSRHGVMFFDAPRAAFTNLREIAKPGAELVFSCFRSPRLNPWASELASLLAVPGNTDPTAPGPFAFADPDHVRAILGEAGWSDINLVEVDFAYVAGVGENPVEDALNLFSRIGPAAPALRALEGIALERALGWMRDWLEQHRSGNLVALGAAAWIVTARA